MKKIFLSLLAINMLIFSGCKKSLLDQNDPNNPTPSGSLATESGMISYAAGILQRTIFDVPNAGNSNILAIAMSTQSVLGDETFVPYGNFGWRWVDQVYRITLPNSTVVTNPFGVTQQVSLQGFNSRAAGDRNAFLYEWTVCYLFINQANTMLSSIDGVGLSGDAATKKAAFKAWAYWWKGLSYSRIGSTYLAGLIYNTIDVNNNYVDHNAIIAEANRNFDLCAAELATLPDDGNEDYDLLMSQMVLSFNDNSHIVSPAMWKRAINSYKARNLLVNKKTADMTAGDWQAIIDLASNGLKSTDNYFKFGMTSDGNNDLSNSFLHPLLLHGPNVQFAFLSERFVQDYKVGDARFTRDVVELPYPPATDAYYDLSAFTDLRARGLQFGTRWGAIPIEDGGSLTTAANEGFTPFACSYEENALMLAEAYINKSQIETGLAYIDAVRDYQNSGLAHVAGTSLNLAQAKEELRRERRIGLAIRGLAFFDARRWGVTAPASAGGGRANAIVYLPSAVAGTATDTPKPCFMEYNYMDYWDVPQNELDFNVPATGSAIVKNP
ncbi:RagB/SusD family nutrient uptake outer membrane protein [Ferruginibacter lapsinanis]|uniref:RagB/SusD family nutrient uptake outer membrane protein n=1 Tax=Ferruginibacter lapsinanis TaxID=563172 RepID=UPI001E3905F7|nr:RagB/SusD family nutrient uptake outer membrane protein [Ferruginibacter lapsinanis]UEG48509.1 RagB/SusD family nutrient uptake outer membrane protein [Ferruginibacter lapsinanis]